MLPSVRGFLYPSDGWWIGPGVLVAIEWPQGRACWTTQEAYRHAQQYETSPIGSPLLGDQDWSAVFCRSCRGHTPLASAQHVLAENSLVRMGCSISARPMGKLLRAESSLPGQRVCRHPGASGGEILPNLITDSIYFIICCGRDRLRYGKDILSSTGNNRPQDIRTRL